MNDLAAESKAFKSAQKAIKLHMTTTKGTEEYVNDCFRYIKIQFGTMP